MFNNPIKIDNGKDFCDNKILPGCKLCCLYTVEHEFLDKNIIELKNINNRFFNIKWNAICNSNVFGKIEIKINDKIEFLGINLGTRTQEEAKKILKFDDKDFKYHEENGVLYLLVKKID
jgi:hypothetical protein